MTARRLAETVARYLAIPLLDGSSSTPVERLPDQLDVTVLQHWRQRIARESLPAVRKPADTAVVIKRADGGAMIELPPVSLWPGMLMFVFGMGMLAFAGTGLTQIFVVGVGGETGTIVPVVIMVVIAAAIVSIVILAFRQLILPGLRRGRIRVTDRAFHFNTAGKRAVIPYAELEELTLLTANGGDRASGGQCVWPH